MSDEEADDIRITLAMILCNQALIITALGSFPEVPRHSLDNASDRAVQKAMEIKKSIQQKHGIKQSVS